MVVEFNPHVRQPQDTPNVSQQSTSLINKEAFTSQLVSAQEGSPFFTKVKSGLYTVFVSPFIWAYNTVKWLVCGCPKAENETTPALKLDVVALLDSGKAAEAFAQEPNKHVAAFIDQAFLQEDFAKVVTEEKKEAFETFFAEFAKSLPNDKDHLFTRKAAAKGVLDTGFLKQAANPNRDPFIKWLSDNVASVATALEKLAAHFSAALENCGNNKAANRLRGFFHDFVPAAMNHIRKDPKTFSPLVLKFFSVNKSEEAILEDMIALFVLNKQLFAGVEHVDVLDTLDVNSVANVAEAARASFNALKFHYNGDANVLGEGVDFEAMPINGRLFEEFMIELLAGLSNEQIDDLIKTVDDRSALAVLFLERLKEAPRNDNRASAIRFLGEVLPQFEAKI